jgi:hypothetical protein
VIRVGQAGLGQWGKNLVRNFAELSDLTWICDERETTVTWCMSTRVYDTTTPRRC